MIFLEIVASKFYLREGMKTLLAFFRLIRSVNLLFIVFTQVLFQYAIIRPSLQLANLTPALSLEHFLLLMFASVCIAAGGYIINDYFDLNIDRVNKPDKLVIEKYIKRRWAIFWHLFLSIVGIGITEYVGVLLGQPYFLGLLNTLCVILLWVYSTTFKKKLLSGNLIISVLTAWVLLILFWIELERTFSGSLTTFHQAAVSRIFKFAMLYGGYAFILSLIREIIKDIEDRVGDLKYGCRTMPIAWGLQTTKIFILTLLVILILSLIILQIYVVVYQWWLSILYAVIFIIAPLIVLYKKVMLASSKEDFNSISQYIKWIMLSGILSMSFILYYA